MFLPQFYCLHHLEGGIIQCLETRAQISKDVKGCTLPREFDCSVFYRDMLWLDFYYLLPFQLYVAWGCDMISKITSLKYGLNVCRMSILSKCGSQRGRRICFMACTTITNLKLLSFPTPRVLSCWCEARAHLESEHLLELLFPVSCCKNPILEKHSFLLLVLIFYFTVDELYKMAFAHWMQPIFANLVGTMWCWQQNWFVRPRDIFALKICFQPLLVLLDFVLRLCVCLCKPSRMKAWTAAWGTGVVLKWSHQAGLRKGCCCWEELSCPLPAIFPAVPLCKQHCWDGCEVKPIQKCIPASTYHISAAHLTVPCNKGWCWPRGRSSQKQKLEQKVTRRGDGGWPQSSSILSSSSVFGWVWCDGER